MVVVVVAEDIPLHTPLRTYQPMEEEEDGCTRTDDNLLLHSADGEEARDGVVEGDRMDQQHFRCKVRAGPFLVVCRIQEASHTKEEEGRKNNHREEEVGLQLVVQENDFPQRDRRLVVAWEHHCYLGREEDDTQGARMGQPRACFMGHFRLMTLSLSDLPV